MSRMGAAAIIFARTLGKGDSAAIAQKVNELGVAFVASMFSVLSNADQEKLLDALEGTPGALDGQLEAAVLQLAEDERVASAARPGGKKQAQVGSVTGRKTESAKLLQASMVARAQLRRASSGCSWSRSGWQRRMPRSLLCLPALREIISHEEAYPFFLQKQALSTMLTLLKDHDGVCPATESGGAADRMRHNFRDFCKVVDLEEQAQAMKNRWVVVDLQAGCVEP